MSVHQVHPRSTFQKQFRTRPLRQQKAKRNFPSSPCRGSVSRLRVEVSRRGSMPRFHAATHPFSQDFLYREQETAFLLRFCAATHHFKKKSLYRDSWIQEKQWHDAATHHFPRNSVCRERETANRSQHTKTTAAPQKSLQESGTIDADTFISGT